MSKLTAAQEKRLEEIAEWAKNTRILFGTKLSTAYLVAGEFVKGLRGLCATGQPPAKASGPQPEYSVENAEA